MMDHALEARGKRLRPALVLLAGSFGDYNLNRLVPLGAAIELLHTASLVHDDVVDGAGSRRGRPTANSVFDNALTVLLGDYMFANAAEMVTRTGSLHVTRLFALTLMKMTSGELDQDAAAFDVSSDIQHYLWRIGGKTAALFANATEGGAVLGGCSEDTVERLRLFGYNAGLAFQIVDDVLDFVGDEAEMGKPAGSDLLEGTITLPALFLMERSRNNAVGRYFRGPTGPGPALQAAIDEVRDSGAIEDAMAMARDYIGRANQAIDSLPDGAPKTALHEIGRHILDRRG
jgi:geranylgeranyl pyrophosphate synthase